MVIDPGHNPGNYNHADEINQQVDAGTLRKACDTTGTSTDNGSSEAAYTLDVSRRLATILRNAGATVILTHNGDRPWGPCITERATIGNDAGAHVAISIHADGHYGGRGFHVIYPPPIDGLTDDIADRSYQLALDIRRTYHNHTHIPYATYTGERGLDARSDLGGLNLSDIPKVFIETGNMRNPTDARLLTSPQSRQRIAQALALGLDRFLQHA